MFLVLFGGGDINIAVVGATGIVGTKIIECLLRLNVLPDRLYLFASKKSDGMRVVFMGKELFIEELCPENISGKHIDIAFFAAGGTVAKSYVHHFLKAGAVVIDNSSAFRLQKGVPLVVPEVNPSDLKLHSGIIANPNCSTIMLMPVLSMLDRLYGVKRCVVATYQAVSGAGAKGLEDLRLGEMGFAAKNSPISLYSNCLPQIGEISPNGYSEEENKIIFESKKILHNNNLRITATAVRVACFNCHSQAVNVELRKKYDDNRLIGQLLNLKGVCLKQSDKSFFVPTTIDADDNFDIFIGRVRRDVSKRNALSFWLVFDNLLKGAALNAVQIAKYLIDNKLL